MKVKKNQGTIAHTVGTINHCPDNILAQMKSIIDENAVLKEKINSKDQIITTLNQTILDLKR